jgi:Ca2+-binding EF-hand superfamily protein
MRTALLALTCLMAPALPARADDQPPKKPQQPPGQAGQADPAAIFERLDRNKDGFLTKDELPERLRDRFDEIDTNKDGKISKEEFVKARGRTSPPAPPLPGSPPPDLLFRLLDTDGDGRLSAEELRNAIKLLEKLDKNKDGYIDRFELEQAMGGRPTPPAGPPAERPEVNRLVERAFEEMDRNKDGKISKDEARGPIAENFDRIDTNKDGFIDREELRQAALRRMMGPGAPPGTTPGTSRALPTFDSLDKDADGRLTREEVQGTPLANRFDEIDTNKDGKIDPKEYEVWVKKQEALGPEKPREPAKK